MRTRATPSGQRPAVVLHVGMGKTGTSTIQAVLNRSRRRLARRGILYPKSPGQRRHIRLGLAMQPDDGVVRQSVGWRRQAVSTPGELRPIFEEALLEELSVSPQHVLFSDEALFIADPGGIANMRELFDRIASSVRVVAYLRRQDGHLCSRYQQMVKREGEVRLLTERAEQDLSDVYDYHARLTTWRELMRPDQLVVRIFEPARFVGGSLVSDFLDATGLDLQAEQLVQVPRRNESIDAETVEFLRVLNLHLRDLGTPPDRALTNDVMRRLRPHTHGRTLTLPERVLDDFMARWRPSNERVARDFVRDAPESLFAARRTGDTTTDQLLDPARFAALLDLVDLPDDWHPPLLRIAEHEAAR